MCIYTVKKQKLKKNSQRGCATPPNVPKLGVSGVKDTAKTNKDLGMSHRWNIVSFPAGISLLTMYKLFSRIFLVLQTETVIKKCLLIFLQIACAKLCNLKIPHHNSHSGINKSV